MTKAFVDQNGVYLFSFAGDIEGPAGSIEVETAPDDARQLWDFSQNKWREAAPVVDVYETAIQRHVDETARTRQFRDGVTLASYVQSTNPQWAAEAQTFVGWRDQVWAYAYQEFAKVQSGERVVPGVDEIISELPAINWP